MKKKLQKKTILLIISIILLLAALLTMSVAWFTRMINVTGSTFNVAQWDSTANYELGNFNVRVYANDSISGGLAAPGTEGEIPVVLSASGSEGNAQFRISIDKSTLSEDFQKRLFFSARSGTSGTQYYNDHGDFITLETTDQYYQGEAARGTSITVMINWKWIYEYTDLLTLSDGAGLSYVNEDYIEYKASHSGYEAWSTFSELRQSESGTAEYNQFISAMSEAFDEFDTLVGCDPDMYEQFMDATIKIYGAEVKPITTQSHN